MPDRREFVSGWSVSPGHTGGMREASARVLFIEDEAVIRHAVTTALIGAGYSVRDQGDGTGLRDLADELLSASRSGATLPGTGKPGGRRCTGRSDPCLGTGTPRIGSPQAIRRSHSSSA